MEKDLEELPNFIRYPQEVLNRVKDLENFMKVIDPNFCILNYPIFVDMENLSKLMLHPQYIKHEDDTHFGNYNNFKHGELFNMNFYCGRNTKGIDLGLN
jgi:hypothetical protein